MKDFFTKIHSTAQKVTLSTQEKADARAHIVAHVFNTNPVSVADVPQLSPWTHIFQFSQHIQIRYVSLVAVMLIIFGGISGAAENSLPGDSLYQVKTSVNENILGLFAFTPQSKAQLHVQLAVRRLEEVQDLAASGKLDDGAKADIEQKLDQHLADLKDSLLVLEQQNPSATTTASSTTIVATSSDVIVATSTDETASSSDTVIAPTATLKVMTMSLVAPISSSSIDASSTASSSLESKIKDASADLKAGADKLDTQNYSEAYALVQKATQTTQEIKTLINDMPKSEAKHDDKGDDKNNTSDATTTSAIATSTQTATVVDSLTTTLGSTTDATSSPKK